jgi:uncharacterized membrane protein YfcA
MIDPAQALSGFAVGAIVGLTGVGGGALMTPLLVLLFGIHPATAVGTDLLHAAITKTGGTYVHARQGRVDWRITGLLAAGSVPAAVATIWTLHALTEVIGNPAHPVFTVLTGVALGFLVSVSSVGAGALGVTALFFLYPRLSAARVVASDLAHAVPLTLVAGCGHWLFGTVDWRLLGSLLVGSLPGIYIGSQFVGRIPDLALRILLAVMLLVVGAKLITF